MELQHQRHKRDRELDTDSGSTADSGWEDFSGMQGASAAGVTVV